MERVARAPLPASCTYWEENQLDFQVNNETYFVNIGEDAGDWEVFVSTPTGARSVPVYDDGASFDESVVLVEDKRARKIIN
jgi:hypothetical protein